MSIDFKSTKGIFQQIAENLCHQILEGKLSPGERVPSIRDLAVQFEVNRNTVLRTFSILNEQGVLENKRGVGFFVALNAIEQIHVNERKEFFINELPDFIQKIKLLKLNSNDLKDLLTAIYKNDHDENQQ